MKPERLIDNLAMLRHPSLEFYPHYNGDDFQKTRLFSIALNGETVGYSMGDWLHQAVEDDRFTRLVRYRVNSDGHHWHEHHHSPDIVTLGCSVTAGMGLPYNFTWPAIVEHITGQTVNNVSRTGHNIWTQVERFVHHIGKYGVPKSVYLLSPDIWRAYIIALSTDGRLGRETLAYNDEINCYTTFNHSKRDHEVYIHTASDNTVGTLPVDLLVDRNLAAYDLLVALCNSLNITVKLFSWHGSSQDIFRKIGYPELQEWPTYISDKGLEHVPPSDYLGWGFPTPAPWVGVDGCCDLEPQSEWQAVAWTSAFDRGEHSLAHPGLHSQIHFAEVMLGQQITSDMIKELKPWYEGTELDELNASNSSGQSGS